MKITLEVPLVEGIVFFFRNQKIEILFTNSVKVVNSVQDEYIAKHDPVTSFSSVKEPVRALIITLVFRLGQAYSK